MIRVITVFMLFMLVGCKKEKSCNIDFALRKKNDNIIKDLAIESMSKKYWNRFDEPYLANSSNETYRLTINDLFGSNSIYKIERHDTDYSFTYKEYFQNSQLEKDSLINSFIKELKSKEGEEMFTFIKEEKFWESLVIIDNSKENIKDGIAIILEGNSPEFRNCTKRKYHILVRNSPKDSTSLKKIWTKFYELKERIK